MISYTNKLYLENSAFSIYIVNGTPLDTDTSQTIRKALEESYAINNSKTNISKTAFEIALKQLI